MTDDEAFVDACRQRARQLQLEVRSPHHDRARAAAVRLAALARFRDVALDQLVSGTVAVHRADALAVIALEHGFVSWPALLEARLSELRRVTMHTARLSAFVNRWFPTHAEAAASLRAEGGYLLPYRREFFVTTADAVRELGLDPHDPDWARIGFDWVQPRDAEAHLRLCRLRWQAMLARGEPLP